MNATEGNLLCVKEAARFLNVSLTTIHRLIRQGEIPVIRVSQRLWRFDKNDLNAYVRKQREMARKQLSEKLKVAQRRGKPVKKGDA